MIKWKILHVTVFLDEGVSVLADNGCTCAVPIACTCTDEVQEATNYDEIKYISVIRKTAKNQPHQHLHHRLDTNRRTYCGTCYHAH